MRLAIWSTTTPRENSTHMEMFRRQLEEVELAERIGIDQICRKCRLRPLQMKSDLIIAVGADPIEVAE